MIGLSVGANMKRNADGTYAKDGDGNYIDDAGSVSFDAMSGSSLTGAIDFGGATQNSALQKEIMESLEKTRLMAGSGYTDFTALDNSHRGSERIFIRSAVAE